MNINLISAIIFYSIIFILIYINRKKFDIHGVIALYKTKIGLKLMDRIANSCPRLLKFLSTTGIYLSFAGMIFITLFLLKGVYNLIFVPEAGPIMSLVIPGIKIPGFIYIPFWYGIISLFIVIVIHEFSHGIIARLHKVPVTSSGVGMLAIIPLAFVEPDQKQLNKKSKKQQLSVFSAGPFSNILSAALIALLIIFCLAPLTNSILAFDGISIESVVEDTPAYEAGVKQGDILIGIDGVAINETNFQELLSSKIPGQPVIFQTAEKNLTVIPAPQKEDGLKPYYGIYMKSKIRLRESVVARFGNKLPWALMYILQFFNWLFTLSLGIGLANLLPLGPVDGGRMTLTTLTKFFPEEKAKKLWKHISFLILLLLIINIAFPFLRKLIHPSL